SFSNGMVNSQSERRSRSQDERTSEDQAPANDLLHPPQVCDGHPCAAGQQDHQPPHDKGRGRGGAGCDFPAVPVGTPATPPEAMKMASVHWRWISEDGRDVSGTGEVAGYNVRDYFDIDLDRILSLPPDAAYEALVDAYKGADSDGISLHWTIDGCDRGRG